MKTVIVTGASRGIGEAVVRRLRVQGVRVVGVARSAEPMRLLAIEKIGSGSFEFVVGDVTDEAVLDKVLQVATMNGQSLDGLILNAAVIGPLERITSISINDMKRHYDVNVHSQLSLLQRCIPHLRQSKGRVIFVSTGAAQNAFAAWTPYCSSKAAMNMAIACIAKEEPSICLMAIKPGIVDTAMSEEATSSHAMQLNPEMGTWLAQVKQTDQFVQPDAPAAAFAKLILEAPMDLSGQFFSYYDEHIQSLLKK